MTSEFQCFDLVVRKLSKEPTSLVDSPPNCQPPLGGFSPEPDNPAPSAPPLPSHEVGVEDVAEGAALTSSFPYQLLLIFLLMH